MLNIKLGKLCIKIDTFYLYALGALPIIALIKQDAWDDCLVAACVLVLLCGWDSYICSKEEKEKKDE